MIPTGVYLLADESVLPFSAWAERVPPVLAAGVRLVQYRAKAVDQALRLNHARQLQAWCTDRRIPLLINDDPELCQQIGAQGVHLGRDDAALQRARALLGPDAWIGVSCYNDLDRARAMTLAGADYVSFGRLFPSRTKPRAEPAALSTLTQARNALNVPICAIGGIDTTNAHQVIGAGAQLLCVAGGILRAADPVAATHKLATIRAKF